MILGAITSVPRGAETRRVLDRLRSVRRGARPEQQIEQKWPSKRITSLPPAQVGVGGQGWVRHPPSLPCSRSSALIPPGIGGSGGNEYEHSSRLTTPTGVKGGD
jgi:hypothetical protein